MKLVTYDDGKVGRIEGDEIVRLDVPTMREYFERGGADDAGERTPLADARLRAPIVPKKFFHTAGNFREHEEESKQRRLVARDRAVDRLLPERRRDRRPRRAGRLPGASDRGARLRARARRRDRQGRQVVRARGGDGLRRRLRHLQRHHGARHPAARDALGVFSFCKAIDTFCPLGPWIVTPDEIPDPHDLAMTLRVNGETRQDVPLGPHVDDDRGDRQPLLAARLLAPATCSRPAR